MGRAETNLLLAALVDPGVSSRWTEADWGLATRQARSANLVAALAERISNATPAIGIPGIVEPVFAAARHVISHRNETVLWECRQIAKALAQLGVTPILLKGAAYVCEGLPLARHRHFGDIDVMVPRRQLGEVETQLMLAGWMPTSQDAYDQRYYRQWMHEVPPLRQIHRGAMLDLHHALTPLTARYQADTAEVFAMACPATALPEVLVLAPTDQILHAAMHLFAEGECDAALRNLYDIVELLRHFASVEADFHDRLVTRAYQVGLARPLFLAIHFVRRTFGMAGLDHVESALAKARPKYLALGALEAIYEPIFQGIHPSVRRPGFALASQALFLRGHWLRMPLRLLLPHLTRKAWRALLDRPEP